MNKELWKLENFMPHQRRNENIFAGNALCERCEGTGNELFSMYRKCSACNGTGINSLGKIAEAKNECAD